MALYVNTNIASLNSQRHLANVTDQLGTSFQRLSSGKRINTAADDAAGLQISTRLESQVQGLNQAARNASDGISVAQTAEGALDEITNMLQRMRVLAIQSANGSNTEGDRQALNNEYIQLTEEINRVSQNTTFGGVLLFDGSYDYDLQVGADPWQTISVSIPEMSPDILKGNPLDQDGNDLGETLLSATNIETADAAQEAMQVIDSSLTIVNSTRSELGAKQNRFSATVRNLTNIAENVSASKARILDADFAEESSKLAVNQIKQQAATNNQLQTGVRENKEEEPIG
jgi:flagellin